MDNCREYTRDSESFRTRNIRTHRKISMAQQSKTAQVDLTEQSIRQEYKDLKTGAHLQCMKEEIEMNRIQRTSTREKSSQ